MSTKVLCSHALLGLAAQQGMGVTACLWTGGFILGE